MERKHFQAMIGSICGTAFFLGGLLLAACLYQYFGWIFATVGAFLLHIALSPLAEGRRERAVLACVVVGAEVFIAGGFLGLTGEMELCWFCVVLGILLIIGGAAAEKR